MLCCQEMGVDERGDESQSDDYKELLDGPEELCGGCLWDVNQDLEQMEYMGASSRSACELGFERVRYGK